MTIQPSELAQQPGPRYKGLADALERAIRDGRLAPGARLPAQRDLAFDLGVTVGTVGRAYELLMQRGLVRGEVGRGTFVLERRPEETALHLPAQKPSGVLDLSVNRPVATAVQARLMRSLATIAEAQAEEAEAGAGDLLTYPPHAGLARHRTAVANWLAGEGVAAAPEEVIITGGAQAGLAAALAAIARPGDTVLIESLCYTAIRSTALTLGLRVEPVAMDGDGIQPEALAAACRQSHAGVLVTSLDLHNPTTITVPRARREALAEVAAAHDLSVIEDEVYGPLLETRPPPMAALIPERTIHITSVSKFLAPGLRLGFVKAPAALVGRITARFADLSLAAPPLIGELFARAREEGLLEVARREQREEMTVRHAMAASRLEGLTLASGPPALHLWIIPPEGLGAEEAAQALAEAGLRVIPSTRFGGGRRDLPQALRLSLGGIADRGELGRALERVRDCLLAADHRHRMII